MGLTASRNGAAEHDETTNRYEDNQLLCFFDGTFADQDVDIRETRRWGQLVGGADLRLEVILFIGEALPAWRPRSSPLT